MREEEIAYRSKIDCYIQQQEQQQQPNDGDSSPINVNFASDFIQSLEENGDLIDFKERTLIVKKSTTKLKQNKTVDSKILDFCYCCYCCRQWSRQASFVGVPAHA